MTKKFEITINNETLEVSYEELEPGGIIVSSTRYKFFRLGDYVGGFTRNTYKADNVLYKDGVRIIWDLVKEKRIKYNRYYLAKGASIVDKRIQGDDLIKKKGIKCPKCGLPDYVTYYGGNSMGAHRCEMCHMDFYEKSIVEVTTAGIIKKVCGECEHYKKGRDCGEDCHFARQLRSEK